MPVERHAEIPAPATERAARRGRDAAEPRLTVAITGASGLIGSALSTLLTTAGHRVVPMVRRPASAGEIGWDPGRNLDPARLAGIDAVVHLAGESLAGGRWSEARKRLIRTSRVDGTATIAHAIAGAADGPRVLISASAMGYYGDRGAEELDERAAPGRGFLPDVARAWEAATEPAARAGARVAITRFGLVLSPAGGLLARILVPFRLGVGGRVGSGTQWMSWISIDDCVAALGHLLLNELEGPFNVTAPDPLPNRSFTRTLARVLGRPAVLPVPRLALRIAFGARADAGMLASTRMIPARLEQSGFAFRHPRLEPALRHLLGRPGTP